MMLSTLAGPHKTWGDFFFGRVWPVTAFVIIVGLVAIQASDPERTKQMLVDRCLSGVSAGPSITLFCTGATFDRSLKSFLGKPEHRHLEVVSIAPYSESMVFGSSGTRGFVVALREKNN